MPTNSTKTAAHAPLYDPNSNQNRDYGLTAWINIGLPANMMVFGLALYGYEWILVNPRDNGFGAPTKIASEYRPWQYNNIREEIEAKSVVPLYNETYAVNYFSIASRWFCYDDSEAISAKVSYAKKKNLLGYFIWQIPFDDKNWTLSLTAQEEGIQRKVIVEGKKNHRRLLNLLLAILLPTITITCLLFISGKWKRRQLKLKNRDLLGKNDSSSPLLHVFSFHEIEIATNDFAFENKLGEGGFGPVYKGKLKGGQEIAVKRLSKTSKQGYEEFKNEVMMTAKLQHINLVKVLGFCTEKEEKMLIYEYMPNKSLDFYLYDPMQSFLLDWEKRMQIVKGITQGLLYLQEYSRLTIIHRDLKASNILLDNEMRPKISDFGMARIFQKDEFEANTEKIVGTYGYIPPEYVQHGTYSTTSDVFSFGVLLLQIMSGRRNTCLYGPNENLNLLEYAYELWSEGKGREFMDTSLDDTITSCKMMRCMQIALLCVQESPSERPSMLEVSTMLITKSVAINAPKRPAFSTKRSARIGETHTSSSQQTVDSATITEVIPR